MAEDDYIWLRTEESLDGAPVRWVVLSPGAVRVEAEVLRPPLRLLHADAQSAIGVDMDDLDIETVVVFRIQR